jgi:hypothetical protein
MKVEQTSELVKAPNSTIQRLVNAIVGAMKINSQELSISNIPYQSITSNWNKWTVSNIWEFKLKTNSTSKNIGCDREKKLQKKFSRKNFPKAEEQN